MTIIRLAVHVDVFQAAQLLEEVKAQPGYPKS